MSAEEAIGRLNAVVTSATEKQCGEGMACVAIADLVALLSLITHQSCINSGPNSTELRSPLPTNVLDNALL
jgi:hypothetical protein